VIVGSVAGGAVGVGGAVSVLLMDKDTRSWVGDHATIDAKGHGTALVGLPDGTLSDSNGSFGHADLRGLAVDAESTEKIFVIAASGAIGGYAGIAGGIAYEGIRSNTRATIGDNAHINTAPEVRFNPSAAGAVDLTADAITLAPDHGLRTGDAVTYDNGGGTSMGGLNSGTTTYYANVSGNTVKLYDT